MVFLLFSLVEKHAKWRIHRGEEWDKSREGHPDFPKFFPVTMRVSLEFLSQELLLLFEFIHVYPKKWHRDLHEYTLW